MLVSEISFKPVHWKVTASGSARDDKGDDGVLEEKGQTDENRRSELRLDVDCSHYERINKRIN